MKGIVARSLIMVLFLLANVLISAQFHCEIYDRINCTFRLFGEFSIKDFNIPGVSYIVMEHNKLDSTVSDA